MENKYSLKTCKIIKDAEVIKEKLNHLYVGTEHLLLSVLKNDENLAELSSKYNLKFDKFLEEVKMYKCEEENNLGVIYTPLLKKVLLDAEKESDGKVSPTDLLKAILAEGDGIAFRILVSMDVDIESLYDEISPEEKSLAGSNLMKIGKNLSLSSPSNPLIGRDEEISLVLETLLRKNKNNPLLIGEAGVGKTAIVEEIAQMIKRKEVPLALQDKTIISLEMGSLVAGTKYRGEFEEKLGGIISELIKNKNIILFIDEIHSISNAGGAEGAINASDILKPYLARGDIKVIGATTINEYNKYILKDKALNRRFEIIKINEPSLKATKNILEKLTPNFEKYYNIKIPSSIPEKIVLATDKYIFNRFNPDKSIDFLDSLCAMKKVRHAQNKKLDIFKREAKSLADEKHKCLVSNDFDKALLIKEKELNLEKKINNEKNKKEVITDKDIEYLLKRQGNIASLKTSESKLYKYLLEFIVGQDEALKEISKLVKIKSDKPVSILLTGSTGTGKTYTVKKLAEYLNTNLIRLDMSEYSEKMSINKLIGSSAGYVGYDDQNVFDKVVASPCPIILLDEIEKAHPSILNLFLQILDEGYVTNSKGNKIDFKNSIIMMTSNAEASKTIGFVPSNEGFKDIFSKEFLARITKVISYKDVDKEMINKYLKKKKITAKDCLKDYDYKTLGFRGIDKYLENKTLVK